MWPMPELPCCATGESFSARSSRSKRRRTPEPSRKTVPSRQLGDLASGRASRGRRRGSPRRQRGRKRARSRGFRSARRARSSLGPQAFDLPPVAVAPVLEAVVEPTDLALPELDRLVADDVAAPMLRPQHVPVRRSAPVTSARRASSSARSASGWLCGEAHAPSCESRGRLAKYSSDAAASRRSIGPRTRTCRSSSRQ